MKAALLPLTMSGNFAIPAIPAALPKIRAQRDNICLTGTYFVPLEPRTLLTNS
jgi:hypothetical protein